MASNPFSGLSKGQKVAVAVGGGVVVFMVYRSYSKAKAASSASAPAATDPNAVDQTANIDPTTGYPYGSVQDTSALAAQSGVASGLGTGYDPNAGYYNPVPTGTQPTTNAAWSQYVEQQLTSIGYDPQAVSAAIGRYLANLPLTSDQATIVQVALAEAGSPPQGSYSVITSGSSAPASGGTTPPPSSGSTSAGAISNLEPSSKSRTGFTVRWNPARGAKGYSYKVTQLNGVVVKGGNTSGTSVSVGGLHPGWTYNFGVQALPGGAGDNIHITLPSK